MHLNGYMHRDIKPDNILFRNSKTTELVIAGILIKNKTLLFFFL